MAPMPPAVTPSPHPSSSSAVAVFPIMKKRPSLHQILPRRSLTVICDDVPAIYRVDGIRTHEFPVIGVYVHPRVIPGFLYRVRPLSTSKYLFGGRALLLTSIGKGYGKRITFRSDEDQRNQNDNFFWSDSREEGFGFELEVVSPGDKFTLYDNHHTKMGNVEVISNEEPQIEQSHLLWPETGTIEKWVVTKLYCKIEFGEDNDRRVISEVISGIAISSKPPARNEVATLTRIMNCKILTHHGKPLKTGLTLIPGVDKETKNERRLTVTGDIPATYTISGLSRFEFPVIGTYVDARVLPGFHYLVRPAHGHGKFQFFGGKPLKLLSIGRGYGKRFTFESPTKNDNDHYFWSDSYPEGFAFAPRAVFVGHRLRILSGGEEVGEAVVRSANHPQEEIQMVSLPGGGILKRFRIEVSCSMVVRSGVVTRLETRACRLCGIAVVIRKGGKGEGRLQQIESPGLESEIHKNFRDIPQGELKMVAHEYQKYLISEEVLDFEE